MEPRVPTFDALMGPALKAMKALGGSATHEGTPGKDRTDWGNPWNCSERNAYPATDEAQLQPGKTYLGKFGALDNLSHGVWAITKKGNALTESDMKQIPVEFGNSTGSKRRRNPKKLMSNHWSPKVRTGRTISSASLHRSILMPSSDWPSEFSANLDS